MHFRKIVAVVVGLFVVTHVAAQTISPKMERMVAKTGTVCYGLNKNANTEISAPAEYLAWKKNPGARIKTANIIVEYVGFTDQAKAAFQAAVDIWSTLIYSSVPIRIHAEWTSLASGVLGSATPYTFYRNFPGAQRDGVWYPIALAEKVANKELNPSTEPDIWASFNSDQTAWYYGSGSILNKYDLTSVVLHEIGHGLGITHSYEVSSGSGQIQSFFGLPVVYESFLQNGSGQNLIESFASPSTALGNQIVGGNLLFKSPLVSSLTSALVKIYAPSTYSAGSSIAHLDETSYPAGNQNSLMTPFFEAAEVNHNPGPLVMAMLKDMGWNSVFINHTPLANTENVSSGYSVTCQIVADTSYNASSLKLSYSIGTGALNTLSMTPTGNPNEFTATLPQPIDGTAQTTYYYFISLSDNLARPFSLPGKLWTQGSTTHTDIVNSFTAGPDHTPPHITHTPVGFIKATDTQLNVTAVLTDNIGIQGGVVQYQINGTPQPDIAMTNTSDSTYTATISSTFADGDVIQYRITATDSSVAKNVAYAPTSSTFYSVNVVGLSATQDSYSNNFNTATSDFFGDALFSISTPTGFADGSINTAHPYPASNPKDSISYVYELRVPIKLKASGSATLKYDEIVLVEPGNAGSTWPDPSNFFDYVIVEGSKDGGTTWRKLINGYDCRDQSIWFTKWNSSLDANSNSLAVGDPTLYRTKTIDMLKTGYFAQGDVIVIRFRLMSDQLAYGWGWSIDNLKIQIDETPPTINHDQVDFVYYKSPSFDLTVKATDASGVKNLSIDYMVNNNNATLTNQSFTLLLNINQYTLTLGMATANFSEPDEIEYRINATDSAGNSVSFPASGFFKIAVLNFKNGVTTYTSDFNSANTDFVGNFLSITTPSGFSSAGINTTHPYTNGFGINNTSNYNYILKKPIVISSTNPKILFREIVIAEFTGTNVKDYVVIEGSKDKGATWHALVSPYSSNGTPVWQNAYNAKSNGAESMFKVREIDLTKSGDFVAGDSVVLRFRMYADAANNGWGWAIDDLSIQGPITAVEELQNQVAVYPNPVSSEYLNIALPGGIKSSSFEMVNTLGQRMLANELDSEIQSHQIFVGNLQGGVYLVKINIDEHVVTKKIVVAR